MANILSDSCSNLLLIIDPQNDFVSPKGSLYVPGAEKSIENIANLISTEGANIDGIAVTMDTHHKYHIAHKSYWIPQPENFSTISYEDLVDGTYKAIGYSDEHDNAKRYLKNLGRPLTIWPDHCLEGSFGWAIPDILMNAIHNWELRKRPVQFADYYQKGISPGFEAFSLFTKAPGLGEYRPYADIDVFADYDKIIVCGVAKDVCVANTVMDMLQDENDYYSGKLVFFEPGMAALDPDSPMNQVFSDAVEHFGAEILTNVD